MKFPKEHYKQAFQNQKSGAKRRGIGWELTFDQWFEWWGEDIDRRGSGHGDLQMQRVADSGPYALGNIRKGYPRDNSRTWARVCANRRAEKAKRDHQNFLDALMFAASKDNHDFDDSEDVAKEMVENSPRPSFKFLADAHR